MILILVFARRHVGRRLSELSGVHLSLNAAGDLELHGFTGDAAALAALEIEIDWVDVDAADGSETTSMGPLGR